MYVGHGVTSRSTLIMGHPFSECRSSSINVFNIYIYVVYTFHHMCTLTSTNTHTYTEGSGASARCKTFLLSTPNEMAK